MADAADGAQPSLSQEPSAAELVKQAAEQVSVLVQDELRLAQLEMTRKGKQAGGGLVALYGVGCLIAGVVVALSGVLAAWLAALIVGAALLAAAGAAALLGKGRLQKATPPVPEEAVGNLKTDGEVIKERTRRGRPADSPEGPRGSPP